MTSTFCQTITSCSATGGTTTTASSTTANATPTWRFIVPVFPDMTGTTNQQNAVINAFTARLEAETNKSTLWTSAVSSGNWTSFWIQQLNDSQVAEYLKDPAVSSSSFFWLKLKGSHCSNRFAGTQIDDAWSISPYRWVFLTCCRWQILPIFQTPLLAPRLPWAPTLALPVVNLPPS
jgi:hypothetical protein